MRNFFRGCSLSQLVDDVASAIFFADSFAYWLPGTSAEYEGSCRLALLKPRKPIGNFYSTKYLICGFSVCFDIIIMPELEAVCIVYTD